jgi:hypothetical protein
VFGNTLTKLRNRLGRGVLTQLSELKMHVRDEQLESDGKNRLKRRFEARAKSKGIPATSTAQTVNPGPPRTLFSTLTNPASVPQFDSTSTNESGATSNRDDSESLNNNPLPGREFRDIIDHHRQLVTNDNDGPGELEGSEAVRVPKILLKDLFDFTSDEWANQYNRYSRVGYDEELELYDLLEMDAEGEADDLDDFTQDILMN